MKLLPVNTTKLFQEAIPYFSAGLQMGIFDIVNPNTHVCSAYKRRARIVLFGTLISLFGEKAIFSVTDETTAMGIQLSSIEYDLQGFNQRNTSVSRFPEDVQKMEHKRTLLHYANRLLVAYSEVRQKPAQV